MVLEFAVEMLDSRTHRTEGKVVNIWKIFWSRRSSYAVSSSKTQKTGKSGCAGNAAGYVYRSIQGNEQSIPRLTKCIIAARRTRMHLIQEEI